MVCKIQSHTNQTTTKGKTKMKTKGFKDENGSVLTSLSYPKSVMMITFSFQLWNNELSLLQGPKNP